MNKEYIRLLERWMKGAAPYLYTISGQSGLACYGTGDNGWGVQTNQKAFAAYAILAADEQLDPVRAGMSREAILNTALSLLRFSLQSHHEGAHRCTDGTKWGHTWISVLGIERMMHGIDAIDEHLTEEDRALLRKVLISESDWLLENYDIVGGLEAKDGRNKPESNLWNGALLHRTAMMYTDCPQVERYKEKGSGLLINANSIPSDALNEAIVDGKPISARFVGANFFESMALNHHGYLNVGYMVICLSNAAMLHFTYKARGIAAPESLYHHVKELWQLVKSCTFPDGRLIRIGGDTRARYTYCQEYLVPVWLLARDLYGDDVANMEKGWLKQIHCEMDVNGDGTFLSKRCGALAKASPLYYARLESDRAAALSMGAIWAELAGRPSTTDEAAPFERETIEPLQSWNDEFHGAYLHRSANRVASWVWDSAEKPQGLCLPPDASHMAEWRENLAGSISGLGKVSGQRLERHAGKSFEGGFITWGSTIYYTHGLIAEGRDAEDIAHNQLVCVAIPDDTHMVMLQHAKALDRRVFVDGVKGLQLLIPNDVYNGNHRSYYYSDGVHPIHGYEAKQEIVDLDSAWANVDDRLGVLAVYGTDQLHVNRPGQRQIGLKRSLRFEEKEGSLYADELCGPIRLGLHSLDPNETILDTGYVLQAGKSHLYTDRYASEGMVRELNGIASDGLIRGVELLGADGIRYLVIANFGMQAEPISFNADYAIWDLAEDSSLEPDASGYVRFTLGAGEGKTFSQITKTYPTGTSTLFR
ncbi:hypothetical protein GC096_11375 [Paenibacillus sp. LMG 31461]|uniref:Uncharacterized protein n=1 Tax=Paenibacillus plantarum TaxID=2654975 RepID=A0ABX1X851_9BACL|nr:hypothetical protein [Paenibacillus plantarum]NOU64630.1 hypothetical protein [Paenibacillus plantarum]